jgi:hypothetical protein
MRLLAAVLLVAGFALVSRTPADAASRTVCAIGCPFATIQAAVDAAADGDTIKIKKGAYVENVVLTDKSLTLQGAGALATVVDGGGVGRAFTITGTFGVTRVKLADLTITGGQTPDLGGGISCGSAELTVTDASIVHNATQGLGGGLYTNCAKTTLVRTLVTENRSDGPGNFDGGGGIAAISGVTLKLANSTVAVNHAVTDGGGILGREASIVVEYGTIAANRAGRFGGGISIDGELTLAASTVVDDVAGQDGGGLYGVDATIAEVKKTTVLHNQPNECGGSGCP